MILKKITLENFRNHQKTILDFDKSTTVFIGENGAGKTNLLEAIYAFAILKPFRNINKKVFIKEEMDYAKISAEAVIIKEKEKNNLEIFWEIYPRQRTVFKKNNIKLSTVKFLEEKNFYAVLFSPEDLNLPFAPPKERRNFMSRILISISYDYFSALFKFEKILKQRNKLLVNFAQQKAQKNEFEYWDNEFVKYGNILIKERKKLIKELNKNIKKYFQEISKNHENLEIIYTPSSEDLENDLIKNFKRDVLMSSTSKGPHRDDFVLYLRSKPLEETGSRGEVRSSILALKLSERDFLKSHTNINPLLLFDDVFSELDAKHREAFFDLVKNYQSIVTTTDIFKNEIKNNKNSIKIYEVKNGEISKEPLEKEINTKISEQ